MSTIVSLPSVKTFVIYQFNKHTAQSVHCTLKAKSRDYKEGQLQLKSVRCCRDDSSWAPCSYSQCPEQEHFPPVLVAIFNIFGGNEHAIFVMGAMFLASALNRGSHLFVVLTHCSKCEPSKGINENVNLTWFVKHALNS